MYWKKEIEQSVIGLTNMIDYFSVRALMRMTSMISSPAQPQTTGGFSQNDLFRGFSSIGNKVIIHIYIDMGQWYCVTYIVYIVV
jgi:hypothetical protein